MTPADASTGLTSSVNGITTLYTLYQYLFGQPNPHENNQGRALRVLSYGRVPYIRLGGHEPYCCTAPEPFALRTSLVRVYDFPPPALRIIDYWVADRFPPA